MKNKITIAGILIIAMMAFGSFASLASAFPEDADYQLFEGSTSGQGNVWSIDKADALDINGEPKFSFGDIIPESVTAYIFLKGTFEEIVLVPAQVIINENRISLIFDPATVHPYVGLVNNCGVTGQLLNGETFLSTGPGFAFARTR